MAVAGRFGAGAYRYYRLIVPIGHPGGKTLFRLTVLSDICEVSSTHQDRARAFAATVLVQGGLLYVLVSGLVVATGQRPVRELITFGVLAPPPAAEPMRVHQTSKATAGKAAPLAQKSHATQVVAPVKTPTPTRIVVTPVVGVGNASLQGAAPLPGPGSGAGGVGTGTGSGDSGAGDGAGGLSAEWISGVIREQDYPRDALESRKEGLVGLRFTVGTNGRVTNCAVTRSSGVPSLDDATCRLIVKRFRYRPARDASGRPVAEVVTGDHDWIIAGPSPASDEDDGD